MIGTVRAALTSMGGGDISFSPYDTAWVALLKKLDGAEGPQFPSCIDWIAKNQLPDGSWGDDAFFLVQDRLINTLSCIMALKTWNVHSDKCNKGLSFIHENIKRLPEDNENWMLVGFETIFPTLLEMAKDIGLDMPCDEPALQDIYAKRNLKLARIPKDVLHSVPTALLFSLEGMPGLDWDRLFKLQSPGGSFMSSAASTAYALMQTGNKKCLEYLTDIVHKFNGGAPFAYPVELFERLWVVDRLERLGLSSYFRSEIDSCLDYAYWHWSDEGIGFTWDDMVRDVDDTAMGFRLLRQHGYHVSTGALKRFETKDGEFVVYPGQSNQSVSAMYNLYRAADQAAFSGDDAVVQRAKAYSYAFLQERRASGNLNDKWIISSGLPSEVAYALDFPWKASLPRVETRMYLEQYGGTDNVWIGKVLYRMHLFNNELFLKLAKADFSNFQRQCRLEWQGLKRWCEKNNLEMYGVTPQSAMRAYFLAAANIFEPDRAAERLGWARTAVIAQAILSSNACTTDSMLEGLISELSSDDHNFARRGGKYSTENGLLTALHELIHLFAPGKDASDNLREAWKTWLMELTTNDGHESCEGKTALLLVRTVEICSGRHCSANQNLKLSEYSQLEKLTSSICSKLGSRIFSQNGTTTENTENLEQQVDQEMQELAQCVFQSCDTISKLTKQTFLHVTRSYCYVAHSSPETIVSHISKVIFEDVV
ncbi:ent-copalyl diphosphate synthase 2-like [Panicum hallii]|uniref:ent-copalyl diphosphate synthase 2-like n=1 Tax=Panicum hallii TaxID=206008 RepID=UPI000DF4D134|nr:ent-copalyl diphosphate synthase 2-like [Panicum hallii]